MNQIRNNPAFISELNYVMEKDGKIIGQNVFVHAEIDGVIGEYIPPECYLADETKAQEFDKSFPAKEKQKLKGQIS